MKTTTAPSAKRQWRRRRERLLREILAPPPKLTVAEWADRYRMLSREASAEPGKWRTDRAPYQRGIYDAVSDPLLERVVMMSSAQVGKTEIINNVAGFHVDQDPAPILVIQPTLDMAEAWSKDRLAPMIRDTPRLRGKIAPARSRDSGNTLLHKNFPGGHLTIVGANSAAGLASRPIRIVLADEVDRYPPSAGAEGDPVSLGVKRTSTFWNRKIVLVSTPTLKGFSRIEGEFEKSDRRFYHVPCPDCGEMQRLVWAQVKWEKGDPLSARYCCAHCGVLVDESQKQRMLDGGRWVAENPGSRVAGFHINALYSPWARWEELVAEWLAAQGNTEALRVFVNTVLGETWEELGEEISEDALRRRREPTREETRTSGYGFEPGFVPAGVGVLTAGADVQGDRLEITVKGWGRGEESWLILHEQVWGDPARDETWSELDRLLGRAWSHEAGASLHIAAACIDTGGHHAEHVYRFVKPRASRKVWAIKGHSQGGRPVWGRPSKPNKHGARLVAIGTDTAKDLLFSRMRVTEHGPGFMHLPRWADDEYVAQLTAEKVVTRYTKGRPVRRYEKTRPRNEALDLEVYAFAALLSLGPSVLENLGVYVQRVNEAGEATKSEQPPGPRQQPRRSGGGWINRWR